MLPSAAADPEWPTPAGEFYIWQLARVPPIGTPLTIH
jgi:hypothetical protein